MDILTITAACIIGTVLCRVLDGNREFGLYIKTAAVIAVLLAIITYVTPIVEAVNRIFNMSGADKSYMTVLFKALGVCYVTQFGYDICKDGGESALASQVELAGKTALVILALPLFETLTDMVLNLT